MNWPEDKLSRFEVARLLGARSLQIALGAPILVSTEKSDSIEIARDEMKKKMIPITIKRKLPNGEYSIVNIKKAIENWIQDSDQA
jgi:DNA-directed RNA polymerase subunit K